MKSYEDLDAYKISMDLIEEIYTLTRSFPKEELYGITSQLKRSSTSIAANIAEGFGRFTYADKAHKYTVSRGESMEVIVFLNIAIRVGILTEEKASKAIYLAKRSGMLLNGLIRSTKNRIR